MKNLLGIDYIRKGVGNKILPIIIWITVKAAKGHFKYVFPFKCFIFGCSKNVDSRLMSLKGSPCQRYYVLKNNVCIPLHVHLKDSEER